MDRHRRTSVRELDTSAVWSHQSTAPATTKGPRASQGSVGAARGEWRHGAGRAPTRLASRAYRATTDQVCGLYPFLSADPMPAVGVPLGVDVHAGTTFSFSPVEWVRRRIVENPNVLLTGRPGAGKSTAAKLAIGRSAAVGVKTLVAGDTKGEYNDLAAWLGVTPTVLGGGNGVRLNPLDGGPLARSLPSDPLARAERVSEVHRRRLALLEALSAMAIARDLTSTERAALGLALHRCEGSERARGALRDPVIGEIAAELDSITRADAEALWFSSIEDFRGELRAVTLGIKSLLDGVLAGIFDGPTTHPVNFCAPIQTVDISRLEARGDEAVAGVLACLSSWSQAAIDDPTADKEAPARQLVRDEMWRQLRYAWLTRKIDSDLRLSRSQGVAQFLITHELGDFDAAAEPEVARGIANKCATRVSYAQTLVATSPAVASLGMNRTECELVSSWTAGQRGRGLWRIGAVRGHVVQTRLSETEIRLTHTDERMR